jgi:hypothetical protein
MSESGVLASEALQKRKRKRAPSKTPHPKGKRHELRYEVLRDNELIAEIGWRNEIQPWSYRTCTKYIDWCHIDKHFPEEKHETHVLHNRALYTSCTNMKMLTRVSEVYNAFWGVPIPEDNCVPLCIWRMVYAEVILGKDVKWSTLNPRSKGGKDPNVVSDIPLHHSLRGSPPPDRVDPLLDDSLQPIGNLQSVPTNGCPPTYGDEVKRLLGDMEDMKGQISSLRDGMISIKDELEILKGDFKKEKEEHQNTKDELNRLVAVQDLDRVVDIASYM